MLIRVLRHQLRHRDQRGQTLLIFALAFLVLMGIVGLATDSAFGYYKSIHIERAAAAAALAGVPYMPASFTTPAGGPNASTRAVAEATANGYTNLVNNTTVTVTTTSSPQELQVTITQLVPTFFLRGLGIQNYTVARTAVARYRQPIALGQPGSNLGATVSQLSSGGSNFYFLRQKGWNTQRGEGDAFTPHPTDGDCTYNYSGGQCGGSPQNAADVHKISGQLGTESIDALTGGAQPLPDRGGYNYLVTIPTGQTGSVQVYNAVYGPDFSAAHNNCENVLVHSGANCSLSGAYYHEDDVGGGNAACTAGAPPVCTPTQQRLYNASEYTLFKVKDIFLRRSDTVLTRTTVFPIDATQWNAATPKYINVKTQTNITQTYNGLGNPTDMQVYHSWADVANLQDAAPPSLIQRTKVGTYADDNLLTEGTYRLRVDSVNFDGVTPTAAGCPTTPNTPATVVCGAASKGYAVRVNGGTCTPATCTISALEDMCVDAPVSGGGGSIPIFNLTSDYAGATVNADFFDVGDTSDTNELSILDPLSGATFDTLGNPPTLNIQVNGINRPPGTALQHYKPQPPDGPLTGPLLPHTGGFPNSQAGFEADTGGASNSNGSWVEFQLPIPSSYPGSANYFKLNYSIANNGTGNDTFTLAVSATGGPIHLLKS